MRYNIFVVFYLIKSIFQVFSSFLIHWYAGGFRAVIFALGSSLRAIDRTVLLRETAANFFLFRPEESAVHYAAAITKKTLRIVLALTLYFIVAATFFSIYIIWAAIPPYLVYKTVYSR